MLGSAAVIPPRRSSTTQHYDTALQGYTELVRRHPDQPAAFLGQARALDHLAEARRSNKLLIDALEAYKRYLAFEQLGPEADAEYRDAAERCIERMRFMGLYSQAVPLHELLVQRFSADTAVRNQLAMTYLMMNRFPEAKRVLAETLRRRPDDGCALAHYGFVLQQHDQDYAGAASFLQRGIDSGAPCTRDGRFYFNLGDALQRLRRKTEAQAIYERGAALGLFPSAYQRSLYNEPQLRAQPIWSSEETGYAPWLQRLAQNWLAIRDEGLSLLSRRGYFVAETERLRDTGEWQQFELYARGRRHEQHCQQAPITCSLVAGFHAASGCRRGQVKFSVLHPGTHVWPHCGPTNCRLRAHLGLVVPQGASLRVAQAERTWREGEFLIFDDSFEHEVWHNGTSLRLVLIVDVWHPDLSAAQRGSLSTI